MANMGEKLQLRDWLLKLLELNQTPGLKWIDKEQGVFAISWRHGRKKGWKSETDSYLFKKWAIYKKRYEPGEDLRNAKLWKSRFRCALNALNDVREVKTLSKSKGEGARKVYQFLQTRSVMKVKGRRFPVRESLNFSKREHCYNKVDKSQAESYQNEMKSPGFHAAFTDYQHTSSAGWQYVSCQTSQELLNISHLLCNLDEDDAEANATIEEFLIPKRQDVQYRNFTTH